MNYIMRNLIENGGYSILPLNAEKLIKKIENKFIKIFQRFQNINNFSQAVNHISNLTEVEYKTIFDAMNMLPELLSLQGHIADSFFSTDLTPLCWTYPNFRVDTKDRNQFTAPLHADDFISFRGKSNLIFWTPLFDENSLDIIPKPNLPVKVIKDKYWGVSLNGDYEEEIVPISIKRNEVFIFRSDTLHQSSRIWNQTNCRLSLQFRFECFEYLPTTFERAVTQKISNEIAEQQKILLEKGQYFGIYSKD